MPPGGVCSPWIKTDYWAWHATLFPTGRSGMHRVAAGDWRTASAGPMQVVSGCRAGRGVSRRLQRAVTDFGADFAFGRVNDKLRDHYGFEMPASSSRFGRGTEARMTVERMQHKLAGGASKAINTFDSQPYRKLNFRTVHYGSDRMELKHRSALFLPSAKSTIRFG